MGRYPETRRKMQIIRRHVENQIGEECPTAPPRSGTYRLISSPEPLLLTKNRLFVPLLASFMYQTRGLQIRTPLCSQVFNFTPRLKAV